jgi:hypothetical protein
MLSANLLSLGVVWQLDPGALLSFHLFVHIFTAILTACVLLPMLWGPETGVLTDVGGPILTALSRKAGPAGRCDRRSRGVLFADLATRA